MNTKESYIKGLERDIRDYYNKVLQLLDLPKIYLNIERDIYGCLGTYNPHDEVITIKIFDSNINIKSCYKMKNMSNNKDFHIFALFHELGHYWHYIKHKGHFRMYMDSYKKQYDLSGEEYNKQNLEKHANNIAKILYKKLYKGE